VCRYHEAFAAANTTEECALTTTGTQVNKASALARLSEETAACDKAAEVFNANETQQVGCAARAFCNAEFRF
jgi:hypothetical protein